MVFTFGCGQHPKKNSGITHPKNEQNGLGWDNGFGPTPNLQFSSQLWGILKANSHQTSSNPQIPKRNPGLVLDLQYLFFLRAGDCESAFFSLMLHQDIIYIYIPAMLLQDLIYMIYIYMHTSKISSSWVTRNKTYCTCTARNYITLSTVLCHLASEYQRENSILPCCAMLK